MAEQYLSGEDFNGHELYDLLCQHNPQDEILRESLKQMALQSATKMKEREATDTSYSRKCIYCFEYIEGGIHNVFKHINEEHYFHLGNPSNIVFGLKLLDILEEMFANMQCLHCNKIFYSHEILRIHMRKKNHRCLNPKDKSYDKFYLLNYLHPGTSWQSAKSEKDYPHRSSKKDDCDIQVIDSLDEIWTDWQDDDNTPKYMCLFCNDKRSSISPDLTDHVTKSHKFDMRTIFKDFSFYDRIKAVNYLRSKVPKAQCPYCNECFSGQSALQTHFKAEGHCKLPTPSKWCLDDEFLKPVLEDDPLLHNLENFMGSCSSDGVDDEKYPVIMEDLPVNDFEDHVLEEINNEQLAEKSKQSTECLFCHKTYYGMSGLSEIISHMHTYHSFDWYLVMQGLPLKQQKCLVKYIRRSSEAMQCYCCSLLFSDNKEFEEHRMTSEHNGRPDVSLYYTKIDVAKLSEYDSTCDPLIVRLERDARVQRTANNSPISLEGCSGDR